MPVKEPQLKKLVRNSIKERFLGKKQNLNESFDVENWLNFLSVQTLFCLMLSQVVRYLYLDKVEDNFIESQGSILALANLLNAS